MTFSDDSTQEFDMENSPSNHEFSASAPQRRKRGRSRALSTMKLYAGAKLKLRVNSNSQPIGEEAQKLSSYIGTLARNVEQTPLIYFTWKELPELYKEDVWKLVEAKYELCDNTLDMDIIKPWVFKVHARLWRSWRCKLRKIYKQYDTHEARIQHREQTVPEIQWELLMRHFDSTESKVKSRKNTVARRLHKFPHTCGTKSFARIRAEIGQDNEQCLSRAQFWIKSHTPAQENVQNEATHEVIEKLKEALANLSDGSTDNPSSKDVLCQVTGADKYGRVRTYGIGVKSSDIFNGPQSKIQLTHQNAALRQEVVDMKQRISSLESQLAKTCELEMQITRMNAINAQLSELFRGISDSQSHATPQSQE